MFNYHIDNFQLIKNKIRKLSDRFEYFKRSDQQSNAVYQYYFL